MRNFIFAFELGEFIGYFSVALVSITSIRLLYYFHSFLFHWPRYRRLVPIKTEDLILLPTIPYIKVQITTKGFLGSTEVIRRGIENITTLAEEDPALYSTKLSLEVVTESWEQKKLLEQEFSQSPISIQIYILLVPAEYETPKGTKLKARALHYVVEQRRQGFNRKPGQTFIIHYDEESVMEPAELRKLIHYLATTDKKLTEGPIYYPLEYMDTNVMCQSMEASRPVDCFECRRVMETGIPLHLHGSNLVVDEDFENELGWDIGTLDGQPFIAEDYIFGVLAYLRQGSQIFGWHGCVMFEQPPFSLRSAFRQRYRWAVGVLQGVAMMQRMTDFQRLSKLMQFRLVWGVRYRILSLALVGFASVSTVFYSLYVAAFALSGQGLPLMPLPVFLWLFFINFLWINLKWVGAWYNLSSVHQLAFSQRLITGGKILAVTPITTILESVIALWALGQWIRRKRRVSWQPTPKTKQADEIVRSIEAI